MQAGSENAAAISRTLLICWGSFQLRIKTGDWNEEPAARVFYCLPKD